MTYCLHGTWNTEALGNAKPPLTLFKNPETGLGNKKRSLGFLFLGHTGLFLFFLQLKNKIPIFLS